MPFPPLFTGIRHLPHVLTVAPTKACLLCATPAGMDLYIQVHARRLLPSAVPWISEDRLLQKQNAKDTHKCNALDKAMSFRYFSFYFRQFGTADAEMKVTCAENPGDCLFLLLLF